MEFKQKMTEVSKKVGDVATETYNTVAEKSSKMFEDAKLRMAISSKENDIEEIFIEIGKTVYDDYKSGKDVGKTFTKEAKKIDSLNQEIAEMNTKILYNKKQRVCEKCGKIIPLESTFCSACGAKQKPVKVKEENKNAKKEEPKQIVCPECGTISDPDSKFCLKCGREFGAKKVATKKVETKVATKKAPAKKTPAKKSSKK